MYHRTVINDTGGKIATGINDTGGKIATGVNNACTLISEYLREFSKKFETAVMVYSGAWGKLIHEKTRSRKSRDTVPLTKCRLYCRREASDGALRDPPERDEGARQHLRHLPDQGQHQSHCTRQLRRTDNKLSRKFVLGYFSIKILFEQFYKNL